MFRTLTKSTGNPVLYHYTPIQVAEILSHNEQVRRGLTTERSRHESGDRISFLFDPAPLDLIAGRYPDDHKAWAPGKQMWENKVRVSDFSPDVTYDVVETESLSRLYDKYYGVVSDQEYWDDVMRISGTEHLSGTSREELMEAVRRFRGQTRAAYKALLSRDDFTIKYRNMYAPRVPHVMVVDPRGAIPVVSSRSVRIGKKL